MSVVQNNSVDQNPNQLSNYSGGPGADEKIERSQDQPDTLSRFSTASEEISKKPTGIEQFVARRLPLEEFIKNPSPVTTDSVSKIDQFMAQQSPLENAINYADAVKPDAVKPDEANSSVGNADAANADAFARSEASVIQVRNGAGSRSAGRGRNLDLSDDTMGRLQLDKNPKLRRALEQLNRVAPLKDEHINKEFEAENIDAPYPDNGGNDPVAERSFKQLVSEMKGELRNKNSELSQIVKEEDKNLRDKVIKFRKMVKNAGGYNKKLEEAFNNHPDFKNDRLSEMKSLSRKNLNAITVRHLLNSNKPGCPKGAASCYRGYEEQGEVFGNKNKLKVQGGVSGRQRNSAIPGFSQHHTGAAFDLMTVNDSWWGSHPKLAQWLENKKNDFDYNIPYLKPGLRNKEPWHLYFNTK
jgi:hypothetical protein